MAYENSACPIELDIDSDRDATFFGCGLEGASDGPGHRGIEMLELQAFFLLRDFFEILINGHGISICRM